MEKIKNFWNNFVSKLKENKAFRLKCAIIAAVAVVACAGIIIACVLAGGSDQPEPSADPSTQTTAPDQTETDPRNLDYSVTVTDAAGAPLVGVIVSFKQNDAVAGMQQTNNQGVATKNLPAGEYTVELAFTDKDANFTYDTATAVVRAEAPALTIVIYNALGEVYSDMNAYSPAEDTHKSFTAYYVTAGHTLVSLDPNDRNYFIFVPTTDGIYEIATDNVAVTVGYYGNTYYVQANNLIEPTESGSIVTDIAPGMINLDGSGTAALVIGLDGNGESSCVLSITRTGDHVPTIEELPWDIYKTTAALSAYSLPDDVELVDFDLTAKTKEYKLVYNKRDGFYHLGKKDGPLVYVKLGVDSKYLSSFQTILDNSGMSRYFFDEEGNFLRKESYTECVLEYIAVMDAEAGVYPLTEDLKYIIQQRGEYVGWWTEDSGTFLFYDTNGNPLVGLNTDIAWLFACCYAQPVEEETKPVPTDPVETTPVQTEPPETEPVETKPAPTEPPETEPPETQPVETTPAPTEPPETEPIETEPENTFKPGKESSDATVEIHYHEIADTMSAELTIKAGEYAKFDLYRMFDMVITIESKDAYIMYGDNEVYLPEDGVVSFELVYGQNDVSSPCSIMIGNSGSKKATFKVQFSIIPGTQNNPEQLKMGNFTTHTDYGEAQGHYYTFTAEKAGTLTVAFKDININKDCQISLYNLNTYVYLVEINGTISIDVNAGDEVQIVIVVADDDYEFPAATIKAKATFK